MNLNGQSINTTIKEQINPAFESVVLGFMTRFGKKHMHSKQSYPPASAASAVYYPSYKNESGLITVKALVP